jgi:ABC-type multidrug transport system fused ATPase/permease subunit
MNRGEKESLWNKLQESFFKLSTEIFKADKENLWLIDFDKPWWYIYWQKRLYLIPGLSMEFTYSVIRVIFPLVVSYSFEKKAYLVLIYFIFFRIILSFIAWWVYKGWVIFIENLPVSIRFSANKFFLTTDPIHHSTRNSGQIVSKIGRAEEASRQLVTDFSWDLVNLLTSLLATVAGFYYIDFKIGTFLALSLILLIVVSIIDNNFRSTIYQVKRIPVEDGLKSVELENLQQTSYIRSLFATQTQLEKVTSKGLQLMNLNYSGWRSGGILWQTITTFYYLIGLFLVLFLINQVENNSLTPLTAIALLTTFLLGTSNVLQAGNLVQSLTRSIISIQDLFDFIKEYGKESYPVLDKKNEK